MRKTEFANGEFYHIYNRGTDKRTIFEDRDDLSRFIESMKDFNIEEPIGSIHEYRFIKKQLGSSTSKLKGENPLVRLIAYCLNPNHFHFLIEQVSDDGVSKFMHRLSTGYTKYFNKKYRRTGVLFSGRFKAIHVDSNEYLLRLSIYVNLNNHVHRIDENSLSVPIASSWGEYENTNVIQRLCDTSVIAEQFKSREQYLDFARETLNQILGNKQAQKELDEVFSE